MITGAPSHNVISRGEGDMSVGDPVNQAQFFSAMAQLEDKMQDYHRRQREHIDQRIGALESVFKAHEVEDRIVERRVTIIETERKSEERQAQKAGAIYGILASAGVNALILGVRKMFGLGG